jgi:hypothetical protein
LQIGSQVVGVIGEGVEVLALQHDAAGVVRGRDVDLRVRIFNVDLLRLHGDGQFDVELLGLAGFDGEVLGVVLGEALGDNTDVVLARRETLDLITALLVCRSSGNLAIR